MDPQRVVADDRIEADFGTVELKYRPLVYNVKNPDNQEIECELGDAPLSMEW